MSRKDVGETPKSGAKSGSEAVVLTTDKNEGKMFADGKLKIPEAKPATPVDAEVPEDQKVKIGGNNLKGEKKVKSKKSKSAPTPKEAGKIPPNKTKELHTQFVGLIQKLIPGSAEEEVPGDVYTVIKAKDGAVLTTIRDRVYPLRVASHKFLDGKAEKLENENQMRDFITRVHKAYQEKTKEKKGQ